MSPPFKAGVLSKAFVEEKLPPWQEATQTSGLRDALELAGSHERGS